MALEGRVDRTPKLTVVPATQGVLEERPDDELMLLARGGRPEAFDVLVRRYQQQVLRTCFRILGELSLAEDAAQAAFVELYRYLPRYRPLGKLRALLHRMALNQSRMLLRSRRAIDRKAGALNLEPLPPSILPDEHILEGERQRGVDAALAQLPRAQRETLALRFAGDLSLEEAAEVLRVPVGTVKSRVFHGLSRLRRLLKPEVP